MDPIEELENMALNAAYEHLSSSRTEPSATQITRWQRIFHFSRSEAVDHIQQLRSDLARTRISNEHWEMVRPEKEAEGYDREAYEYGIQLSRKTSFKSSPSKEHNSGTSAARALSSFLVQLDGPLDTPQKVQEAVGLATVPRVIEGTGNSGVTKFCRIDGLAKDALQKWLSEVQVGFRPTFIRLSKAKKDLSSDSNYPTLGLDATFPQHRPDGKETNFSPAQDQYPVCYFFYGTLGDPTVLSNVISLPEGESPDLKPARITRGTIETWGGKYKALVDAPDTAHTDGWAFKVKSNVEEEALLFYETEKYEVVRCDITFKGEEQSIRGCTFRFVGFLSDVR